MTSLIPVTTLLATRKTIKNNTPKLNHSIIELGTTITSVSSFQMVDFSDYTHKCPDGVSSLYPKRDQRNITGLSSPPLSRKPFQIVIHNTNIIIVFIMFNHFIFKIHHIVFFIVFLYCSN